MPTGVFQADFTSFNDAVRQAEIHLRTFESGSAQVATQLARMDDAFSGRRIISEATLMSEVFARAGGSAAFTTAELARMGAVGAEAMEKMTRTGVAIPKQLQEMATATSAAIPPTQSLTKTYQQFDGVLASMGIHIGPQVKALEDLAAASGKTASQVGALGTAGLVLGTAYAGWQVGRMIADFTGLDKVVEQVGRGLFNLGNTAVETAGAKLDTIRRAYELGAKAGISYAEAIEYIERVTKKSVMAQIDWSTTLLRAKQEVADLTEVKKRYIAIAQEAGATTEQITAKYNVSALALKLLADAQRDAAQATKEHDAEQKKIAETSRLLAAEREQRIKEQMEEARQGAERVRAAEESQRAINGLINAYGQLSKQQAEQRKSDQALSEQTKMLEADYQAMVEATVETGVAHQAAGEMARAATADTAAGYAQVGAQITITGDAVREWLRLMEYTQKANAILAENSLYTTLAQKQRVAAITMAPAPNLPSGIDTMTNRGVQLTNTFNLVDTESNLTRRIADNIMQSVRSGVQL